MTCSIGENKQQGHAPLQFLKKRYATSRAPHQGPPDEANVY